MKGTPKLERGGRGSRQAKSKLVLEEFVTCGSLLHVEAWYMWNLLFKMKQ